MYRKDVLFLAFFSHAAGLGTSLGPGIQNPSPEGGRKYEVPKVDDVDPELLKPIPDDGENFKKDFHFCVCVCIKVHFNMCLGLINCLNR